jgi:PAS domain S-box-containing protein
MMPERIERQDGEQELAVQRERFQLLVEGVKEYAILMLDPDGKIVSWNGGAERIKGYAAEEVLGRHFSLFYTPDAIEEGHPEMELRVHRRGPLRGGGLARAQGRWAFLGQRADHGARG